MTKFGYTQTLEHKKKISESMKGITPWNKDNSLSLNHKKNISLSKIGTKRKPFSEEHRTKMKLAKLGKKRLPFSKEWKKNIKKSWTNERIIKWKELRKTIKIPTKDTKPEKTLQKILTENNINFRKHEPITGQPDIYIPDKNLCIFVDGCYWHGCKKCGFYDKEKSLKDKRITHSLQKDGYRVIRIWEHTLKTNILEVHSLMLEQDD